MAVREKHLLLSVFTQLPKSKALLENTMNGILCRAEELVSTGNAITTAAVKGTARMVKSKSNMLLEILLAGLLPTQKQPNLTKMSTSCNGPNVGKKTITKLLPTEKSQASCFSSHN